MTEILNLLKTKVPSDILNQIIFLKEWVEPPNFATMKSRERIQLMPKYIHKSVAPTEANFWIWFGAYATKDHSPIFYNDRVPRLLYEFINGPLLWPGPEKRKRRLVNAMTQHVSDVNIYKYVPAMGSRYKTLRNEIKANGKEINFSLLYTEEARKIREKQTAEALEFLENNIEDFRNPSDWNIALKALSYEPLVITSVIEHLKEKYNVPSDTSPNGTPQSPTAHNHSAVTDEISNPHESESITDTPLESLSEDVVQKS